MRAIYCYKPVKGLLGEYIHYKPMDEKFFTLAKKSVESVKKYYKTTFYSDAQTYEIFTENGIFFDEVILLKELEETSFRNYSLPKIYTMINQTKPYVMFDFDTIITEELKSDSDITYAFYEFDFTNLFNPKVVRWVTDSYINPWFNKIEKFYKDGYSDNFDWRRYPNFSALMVNDFEMVKQCYTEMLNNIPIDVIEDTTPTLIEQFLLHQYVVINNKSYDTFIYEATRLNDLKPEKLYHININEADLNQVSKSIQEFNKH